MRHRTFLPMLPVLVVATVLAGGADAGAYVGQLKRTRI